MAVQVREGANFQFVRDLKIRLDNAVVSGDKLRTSVAEYVEEHGHLDIDLTLTRSSLQREIKVLEEVERGAIHYLEEVRMQTCCALQQTPAKVWTFWGAEHVMWAVSIGAGVIHLLNPAVSKVAGIVNATAGFFQGSCSRLGKHQLNKRVAFETAITDLLGIRDMARRVLKDFGYALAFYEADAAVERRLSPHTVPEESKLDATATGQWLVEKLKSVWAKSAGAAPLSREELAARWLSRLSAYQLEMMPHFGDSVEAQILEEAKERRLGKLRDGVSLMGMVPRAVERSLADEAEIVVQVDEMDTKEPVSMPKTGDANSLLIGPPAAFIADMEREMYEVAASGDTIRAFAASHVRDKARRRHNYSMHIGLLEQHILTLTKIKNYASAVLPKVEGSCAKDRALTAVEYALWISNLTLGITITVSEDVEELRKLNLMLLFGQVIVSNASTLLKQSLVAEGKLMGRYKRLKDESLRFLQLFKGSIALLQGCPMAEREASPELIAASLEKTLREQAQARLRPMRVLARHLMEDEARRSCRDVRTYPYPDTPLGRMLKEAAERIVLGNKK